MSSEVTAGRRWCYDLSADPLSARLLLPDHEAARRKVLPTPARHDRAARQPVEAAYRLSKRASTAIIAVARPAHSLARAFEHQLAFAPDDHDARGHDHDPRRPASPAPATSLETFIAHDECRSIEAYSKGAWTRRRPWRVAVRQRICPTPPNRGPHRSVIAENLPAWNGVQPHGRVRRQEVSR